MNVGSTLQGKITETKLNVKITRTRSLPHITIEFFGCHLTITQCIVVYYFGLGNVQISYDDSGDGVCSSRQSAVILGRGSWPNRYITFIGTEKA